MQAVRENRYIILAKDFEKAYKKAIKKDDQEHDFYKQSQSAIYALTLPIVTALPNYNYSDTKTSLPDCTNQSSNV